MVLIGKQLSACITILIAGATLSASDFALVGATLHDGVGGVIEDGALVVEGGKISAVGKRLEVMIPERLRTIDSRGQHLTPGLVDLYSRLFVREADLRDLGASESRTVLDALDPFDLLWTTARSHGITTVAISPGVSQGAGGLGAVVKLKGDRGELIARESHYIAALGVSTERSLSAERLEQYYRLRNLFNSAREYRKSWDTHWKAVEKHNEEVRKRKENDKNPLPASQPRAGGEPPRLPELPKPPRPPALDVGREALAMALEGKLPVFLEAHRRDDLEYALLLKKEMGLRLVILGATQGHTMREALKASGATVAVEPVLCDRNALEYRDHTECNAALLAGAKVPLAIASAGQTGLSASRLRLQATVAVRGGLPPEEALRAVTSVPARVLGLDGRLGSLAVGKDADLVIFSGEPLDFSSRIEWVCVEGEMFKVDAPAGSARGPLDATSTAEELPRIARSAAACAEAPVPASASIVAWRGARILTAVGGRVREIERGVIVARGGRIEAVGGAETSIPAGAQVWEVEGRWILPGFLDAHSHAGIAGETDDISSAISEDLRVIDGFDPWDKELSLRLASGITTVALSPGSANVVGGRISLLKVVPGSARLRILRDPAGVKTSLAPLLSLPRYPTALSGAVAALEEWAWSRPFKPGFAGTIVVEVPSRTASDRALEILGCTGARVAVYDAGRITQAGWLGAKRPQFAILGPLALGEAAPRLRSAAALCRLGTRIAFSMGGTRRDLLSSAILAMEQGLSRDEALLALTAWPAELYGVPGCVGSLEVGADADLVVWSGDPFTLARRIESVAIDGETLFVPGMASVPAGGGDVKND